jgi:hypothetical protein
MKRFAIVWLTIVISLVTAIHQPYNAPSFIVPSCCCETDCQCEHPKNNAVRLRNIQCGDTTTMGIATPSNETRVTFSYQLFKVMNHPAQINHHPLMSTAYKKITQDPPPPKTTG